MGFIVFHFKIIRSLAHKFWIKKIRFYNSKTSTDKSDIADNYVDVDSEIILEMFHLCIRIRQYPAETV